jgi:hypothetical protein
MGLTVLVSRTERAVTLVRWFLDPEKHWEFASGPLLWFSASEFREKGYEIVRRHFRQYKAHRIQPDAIEPLHPPAEERRFKKFLDDQRPVRIGEDPPGMLRLIPMEFRRNSLASLKSLPGDAERKAPLDAPAEAFWKAFDEVLAATE